MSKRPRIGVSVSARSGWRVYPFFKLALWRAGGRAVRIQTGRERRSLEGLDAVIIGGGDDINVELYGGWLVPHAVFDDARDMLEKALIEEAEQRCLPILGVCRGSQLVNVVRGGNLHQDIYEAYPGAAEIHTPLPRKRISIKPGSRLASFYGAEPSMVNSLHKQSVDRLGRNLQSVAWDEAGVVQAIESTSERLVIGVQWHPEYLAFSKRDHGLFIALVEAARRSYAPDPARGAETARA
ncbi:MAG TPA: gamma-glutamyl-gamma-aminobutyrate hydrolase family protein [Thermohalobaculum sp.]|nr:gamma-glutamyl-gamma-aminobutyrate hydrolase family protein [Thermohalobaculum sp.]